MDPRPPFCGCCPGLPAGACSWAQFVASLPPDDPVRLRDEANDPSQDWHDWRWTGEMCRCPCHDHED